MEGVDPMTLHDAAVGHEAAADYSLLLAEAAHVLMDLASARPQDRAEELATLRDIYAEGSEFVGMPGIPSALRGLFDSILTLGARIASYPARLPETTLAQVHVIDSMARSLATAMDEPSLVGRSVEDINRGIAALTRATPVSKSLDDAAHSAHVALKNFVGNWQH